MRNKKATRMSKLRKRKQEETKKNIFNLTKFIFKNICYLIIGLSYLIIKIYMAIETAFINFFNRLPKWTKRVIILTMFVHILILNDTEVEVIEKVVTQTKTIIIAEEVKALESEETVIGDESETMECQYEGYYECLIYDKALEYELTEEEIKIAIAISKWETGNYTSDLFIKNNNIGGLYNSSERKFYSYSTKLDGIDSFIRNLKKGYFNKGLDTIEKIQKKYAPLNAANDPNGLNNNWINGVTYFYNQL